MTDQTPLDIAHAAMEAAPEDDAARLRFYEVLAAGELFLLLEGEAEPGSLSPRTITVQGDDYVIAFDDEARLAAFSGAAADYAGLPGRAVVQMLAAEGAGLALNPEVAPSQALLPPAALEWLTQLLANAPGRLEARPQELTAPRGLPPLVAEALSRRLAGAPGLATCAWLAGVRYEGGGQGHLLAFIDPAEGAEEPLAQAVGEALAFSGVEAGVLDVAFFGAADPVTARLEKTGMRFDLPEPVRAERSHPQAPGMDPEKPPRLK